MAMARPENKFCVPSPSEKKQKLNFLKYAATLLCYVYALCARIRNKMRSTTVLGVFLGIGKALAVRLSESATGIDTCRGAVRSRPVIGSIPLLNDTLARVGAVEAAGSFTCPVTGINPARAQGWGFFDGPPNPPSAYWPTASIIPSGFAISQGLLGNMQVLHYSLRISHLGAAIR